MCTVSVEHIIDFLELIIYIIECRFLLVCSHFCLMKNKEKGTKHQNIQPKEAFLSHL